ncbi:hypothetical protein [Ferrovibrio terrae]|uniref:hypothetical protein n=1 Tax=Ferrovibrio terrae TaxID=2594003 RepID=UPI003137B926
MSNFKIAMALQPSAAQLLGLLVAVPDIARKEFTRAGWEGSMLLQRETQEETPTGVGAGGGLRGSIIAIKPVVSALNIEAGAGTSAAHAIPVELGSKPHRPPVKPLEDWAHLKLGLPYDEAAAAAWRIASAISRRGTKPAHMFKRAFERNRGQVQRIFEKAGARVRDQAGRRR